MKKNIITYLAIAIIVFILFFSVRGKDKDEKKIEDLKKLLEILVGLPNWENYDSLVNAYNQATAEDRENFINSLNESQLDFLVECQNKFIHPSGLELYSRAYNKASGY